MGFLRALTRRKFIDSSTVGDTQLARCLTTLDLTALGIGSTLGAGIYVVAGQVAKQTSGPSVFLSFMIAAVASILAAAVKSIAAAPKNYEGGISTVSSVSKTQGLCYAEFGARVPRTGSAYVYSYVTVGELMAFVIGWNLILEYVIGTASVARAWSAYFDSLVHNKIQHFFMENFRMHISGLSEYPDFFALAITLLLTVILAIGVKESSRFNNIFTGVNLLVVTYIIICGAFKADTHNWRIDPSQVVGTNKTDIGSGGFMPFGFSGMLSGAATCFYAFVGFDAIATTGEEVKNPQKAIPISIVVSLFACFVAYSGISVIITLMCPFYLLDGDAPLPAVFDRVGWHIARYIIAVGAVCGLSTSLLGAMFPLPRVIYAIASDGLIFRFLASVNDRFKTPLIATIISGVFAGLMAMMFDLSELVDMMSIGTLLAYTLVAVSVLLLRYQVKNIGEVEDTKLSDSSRASKLSDDKSGTAKALLCHIFNFNKRDASESTEKLVVYEVTIFFVVSVLAGVFLSLAEVELSEGKWYAILITVILGGLLVVITISLALQPQNQTKLSFKVPWVPFVPCVSIFVNLFLMIRLPVATWIRFAVWMVIGFTIYFAYGMWHSSESGPSDLDLHTFQPLLQHDSEETAEEFEVTGNVFIDNSDVDE